MKHFSIEPFKSWFGYTRRERRASFMLLILILVVILIRLIIPDRKIPIEEIALSISGNDEILATGSVTGHQQGRTSRSSYQQGKPKIELNTCDSASLESLPGRGPFYRQGLSGTEICSEDLPQSHS